MKVFLVILFALDNGMIIRGDDYGDGWAAREQPSFAVCLKRAKYMYANPAPLPQGVKAMVQFCEVR